MSYVNINAWKAYWEEKGSGSRKRDKPSDYCFIDAWGLMLARGLFWDYSDLIESESYSCYPVSEKKSCAGKWSRGTGDFLLKKNVSFQLQLDMQMTAAFFGYFISSYPFSPG